VKDAAKGTLADLLAGYRMLDVTYVCVDAAEADRLPAEAVLAPAVVKALPAPVAPGHGVFQPRNHPVVGRRRLAQRRPGRRAQTARLIELFCEERVPLLLALTGIAMSSFLAMLFSMFEPRHTAAWNMGSQGSVAADVMGVRKGRLPVAVSPWGDLAVAMRIVRPWVVPFPAVLGLGFLSLRLIGRARRRRRFRAAWALCRRWPGARRLRWPSAGEPTDAQRGRSAGRSASGSASRAA
jgi:hypothetical protein